MSTKISILQLMQTMINTMAPLDISDESLYVKFIKSNQKTKREKLKIVDQNNVFSEIDRLEIDRCIYQSKQISSNLIIIRKNLREIEMLLGKCLKNYLSQKTFYEMSESFEIFFQKNIDIEKMYESTNSLINNFFLDYIPKYSSITLKNKSVDMLLELQTLRRFLLKDFIKKINHDTISDTNLISNMNRIKNNSISILVNGFQLMTNISKLIDNNVTWIE